MRYTLSIFLLLSSIMVNAQDSIRYKRIKEDSMVVKVHAPYDKVNSVHRFFFGENYRKEWAANVKLPVLRISELHGGLIPEKKGGGFQTTSLRLTDPTGKEWVLRSVEKDPAVVLPPELRQTFARELLIDAISAQHPFSALMVPPLAQAAGVLHTNPVIGIVSGDKNLGEYNKLFEGLVCLLEEREPAGKSDKTIEVVQHLNDDNDYSFNGKAFLTARCLDVLIGDWDRHDDNWRFIKEKEGKDKIYLPVPRDRDQVLYVNQGVFPWLTSRRWVVPTLQTFGSDIRDIRYSMFKTTWLDRFPYSRFSHEEWMKVVNDFVAAETDEVLEAGLKRLPACVYKLRHAQLLKQLKDRRANLPEAMDEYYQFVNKIIDIHLSNKNELVNIEDTADKGLKITINKIGKNVKGDEILNKTFDPEITREIRFYTGAGNDCIILNNKLSSIKLRIVDSLDHKNYNIIKSANTVNIYNNGRRLSLNGDSSNIRVHASKDSANKSFLPVNLYNVLMPLANIQVNADDGLLLGAGFRYIRQEGFRTVPYKSLQEVLVSGSFSTAALNLRYRGEWLHVLGNADIVLTANVKTPNNTINFFGLGNESVYDQQQNLKYYRTRFNTYQFDPVLRWRTEGGVWKNALGSSKTPPGISFSIGPSFQYYHIDLSDNTGRFINNTSQINSYDSLTISKDKLHAGLVAAFVVDNRNNRLLTSDGSYIGVKAQSYVGLSDYSKSYTQVTCNLAFYKSFADTSIVIANRIGGGVTFGNPAFYQALYLGGQDNFLGFRQYRFGGKQMVFNNLEVRVKLFKIASYVLPGQFGLTGFFDTGRVWVDNERSNKWHTGTGGGIYFSPAGLLLIQAVAGHSIEGWYPYISMGLRF